MKQHNKTTRPQIDRNVEDYNEISLCVMSGFIVVGRGALGARAAPGPEPKVLCGTL